jgi:prepilin-type N-terminal cleavage/methylation domain-containing protein/prepilin-type processing-associated H-X9-DG protein
MGGNSQRACEAVPRPLTNKGAFTLVELLVVIGIIALLISILLPALNKAREQANLAECGSNLRSMGQLIQIYIAENGGYYPYGHVNAVSGPYEGLGTDPNEGPWYTQTWDWPDTLTRLNVKTMPGQTGSGYPYWTNDGGDTQQLQSYEQCMAADFSKVFHDADTSPGGYLTRVSDYVGNIRVFAAPCMPDAIALAQGNPPLGAVSGEYFEPIRPASSFKRPSEEMMIWCGPQNLTTGGPAISSAGLLGPLCDQIDESAPTWGAGGYGMLYPTPSSSTYLTADYTAPIALGNVSGIGSTAFATLIGNGQYQKVMKLINAQNIDTFNSLTNYGATCQMRFRHLNNTTVNALFIDGHVESRLIGAVVAKDISVDWYNPGPPPPAP